MHQSAPAAHSTGKAHFAHTLRRPYNAVGSIIYAVLGAINLRRLYGIGQPLIWRTTAGWWSLVVVGVGSFLFHLTMRYHMELLDEIPMLILVACGCLQISDVHPWGRKYRFLGLALIDVVLVGGLTVLTAVYLVTRIFGLFITGFTVGVIFLLAIYLSERSNMGAQYNRLGSRAAVLMIAARVFWELENHLCQEHPYLWPFHNVCHLGSCLAASDLFLQGYYYRIDKLGAGGVVRAVKQGRADKPKLPTLLPMLLFGPKSALPMVEQASAMGV